MDQEDFPTEEEGQELPVDPGDEPQPEVRLVTRKYNGNEYEMPEHLAEVWDQRNQAYVRQLSEQADRIRRESFQQAPPQRHDTPPPGQQDFDTEWYASPNQAWERRERQLRQEFAEELDRRESQRIFWNDFRDENPDLRGKDTIVRAVLQEKLPEMRYMSAEEGRVYLAEATRALINGDTPPAKRTPAPSTRQVDSPPARPPGPARRSLAPQAESGSLQDSIRAMQAAKRRAVNFDFNDTDNPRPRPTRRGPPS